jgi:adenosylmethionine-8-amino-7-oxononanoate aminotransferase
VRTTPTTRPERGGPQDLFFATRVTEGLPRIVRGEGVHLVDEDGRHYLDAASGAFLANLGQGNERVIAAMAEQARRLSFSYIRTTRHDPNAALTERISRLAGAGFERVHLSSGGSEANEMAIKFLRALAVARGEAQRHRLVTLMPSYHGATLAALGMNGDLSVEALWGPLTRLSEKIPAPLTYRAESPEAAARASIAALSETLARVGPETVLALVVEPVGGQSTGANVPHPSFFAEARRICTQHGIRLVFDEVMSAVRCGRFLAAHLQPDALPDVVVMAKGLGAGYAPLGAVLAPAADVDELAARTGFNLSHTYSANPIACASGCAVLDEVVDRDLTGNAERMGARLRAGLEALGERSPLVGDVRGRGLLLGVELVRDRAGARPFGSEVDPADVLRRHGTRHGLLLYARRQNAGRFGDWSTIAPPLTISADEVDELVERLGRALDDATAELLP